MGTQVFDDGSTLTVGGDGSVTSTPAWDWSPSSYGNAFNAGPASSGNTLQDLAKLALGGYSQYRIAALQQQNSVPTTARAPSAVGASPLQSMGMGAGMVPLLLLGAVGLVLVLRATK